MSAVSGTILKNIPFFSAFTDAELEQIFHLGSLQTLKPQTSAVIEGEPTRGIGILIAGNMSVHKADPETGTLHRIALLKEGAVFGELSLFDDAPRSATVIAENMCQLFALDAGNFQAFIDRSSGDVQARFYRRCVEELASRFRLLNVDYINSQLLLWKYAFRKTQ